MELGSLHWFLTDFKPRLKKKILHEKLLFGCAKPKTMGFKSCAIAVVS